MQSHLFSTILLDYLQDYYIIYKDGFARIKELLISYSYLSETTFIYTINKTLFTVL
jgi:hypothetical protein